MSIYREIWEQYNNNTIPEGWHIHHLDGDNTNNTPENLICVSAHVHWCIHLLQGDPVALKGKFIQGAAEAGKRSIAKGHGWGPEHQASPEGRERTRQFHLGRKRSKTTRERISKATKGKSKDFTEETLNALRERTVKMNKTRKNPNKKKKWVNNGKEALMVKASEVNVYIENGWVLGRVGSEGFVGKK